MILKTAYLRKGRGGRLRGVAEFIKSDGATIQMSTTFETTRKREARAMLDEWVASLVSDGGAATASSETADNGKQDDTTAKSPRNILVLEYVSDMVESLGSSGAIEPSTVRDYRTSMTRLRRGLDGVELARLTPEKIREWESSLTASGLSSSSVGKAHRLLKQACRQAVADRVLQANPCDSVKPPKRKNKNPGINYAQKDERRRLLDVLGTAPLSPVTVAARIALYVGFREGEICGLRWVDADLEGLVLWERRAVGIGDGGAYLKESKTDEARDATMPQSLAEILMQWRSQQGEPAETSYILTGTDRFMHPGTLCRQWKSVAELLGLKGSEGRRVTFHDLRHTWATVAVASGVDIKTVASNLGHANAAMTLNIYASADPDAKRHAASIMDGAI